MHLPAHTYLQGGKYKIIEKIGQGGFGIAYKAHHLLLDRTVCIKEFFYSDLCERKTGSSELTIISASSDKIQLVNSFRRKFVKEAQRLATFQHPNIVQITDVFEENNTAYFVMEYLEGGSLQDKLEIGTLTEKQTLKIILPVLEALSIIHKAKLLHLDIKPTNIMFRKDKTPVLIDFGISKYMANSTGHTSTAPIGLSKGYAPLEQYGGDIANFSEATDIYSLCATIYRMVTGVVPPEPLQILGSGMKEAKDFNPNLSDILNSLIIKGMSINPGDRYSNAIDLTSKLKSEKSAKKESTERNTQSTIISPKSLLKLDKYENIESFSEGLARVELNGKYGLINKTGMQVVPCIYEYAYSFSEGLAQVKLNGKYGFIDKTGTQVTPCIYDDAEDFSEGLAQVELNGKWGFINKTGNHTIPCIYDDACHFSEGLAAVERKKAFFKKRWTFIDKTGTQVIPCRYDIAGPFSEGLAPVKLNGKWEFIDKTGTQVIPCRYENVSCFSDGLVKVGLNGKCGFIDKTGTQVIPCIYDNTDWFFEGLAWVKLNDKYGFFDKTGTQVIPCIYDNAMSFSEGLAQVELNGKYGFIDKKGNIILE